MVNEPKSEGLKHDKEKTMRGNWFKNFDSGVKAKKTEIKSLNHIKSKEKFAEAFTNMVYRNSLYDGTDIFEDVREATRIFILCYMEGVISQQRLIEYFTNVVYTNNESGNLNLVQMAEYFLYKRDTLK